MKRITLSENKLSVLKENINGIMSSKLPDYVYKSVKEHNTSLGENLAFPPSHNYAFDYIILKKRYSEIVQRMISYKFPLDVQEAENLLRKYSVEARKQELPLRPQLVVLIENVINKLFAVPSDTVIFHCELVDEVQSDNSIRVVPEDNNGAEYTFDDVNEIDLSDKIVQQRRFLNALIQGYSLIASRKKDLYSDYFSDKEDLLNLYDKINLLNDYLVFSKKEKINMKDPKLVAYVSVHLGHNDKKTEIRSKGILFPYLLKESIRGFLELFSSHGLPKDRHKAQMIIKRSDFLMAEPWDMRFGKTLWDTMFGYREIDTTLIPYVFSDYCSLQPNEFFDVSKELLAKTKKGKEWLNNEVQITKHNYDYQDFLNQIQQKNIDNALIADNQYLSIEDLQNMDGKTITEAIDEYADANPNLKSFKNYIQQDNDSFNDEQCYWVATDIIYLIPNFRQAKEQYGVTIEDYIEMKKACNDDYGDGQEIIMRIVEKYPELKRALVGYAKSQAYTADDGNSHECFDYENDININSNTWLIHFTSYDPYHFARVGFTAGTPYYESLGLTYGREKYSAGYNFAFVADNVTNDNTRYAGDATKGGAVMFHADGIEAYHNGDREHQVVFWGPSARDIVPILYGDVYDYYDWDNNDGENQYYRNRGNYDDAWYILDNNNRLLYSNSDIKKVIQWVETNYIQYKKQITGWANSDYFKPRRKRKLGENIETEYAEANPHLKQFKNIIKNPYNSKNQAIIDELPYIFDHMDDYDEDVQEDLKYLKELYDKKDFKEISYFLSNNDDLCDALAAEANYDYSYYDPQEMYDYQEDIDINKGKWLVHFSTDSEEIIKNGFTQGTPEAKMLAISHGKQFGSEGYNFAFDIDDVDNGAARYYLSSYVFDKPCAVMFQADGINAYHNGDNQNQVIFWGPSARNFVGLWFGKINMNYNNHFDKPHGKYQWYIKGNNGKIFYSSDYVEEVCQWVQENYQQYHRQLTTENINKLVDDKGQILEYVDKYGKPLKQYFQQSDEEYF